MGGEGGKFSTLPLTAKAVHGHTPPRPTASGTGLKVKDRVLLLLDCEGVHTY